MSLKIKIQSGVVQRYYSYLNGPQNIMLDVTQRCNLFCQHCYNESSSSFNSDLDDESMLKIVDQIIEVNPLIVCLCGGEPTMRFDLILEIARRLTSHKIAVNMVSNGHSLSKENLIKLYSSGIRNIQISLDSYRPEVVDAFRGCKGAFHNAVTAIDNMISINQTPAVTFIPTKLNYKDIGGLAEFVYSKGIRALRYMPLVPIGRGNRNLEKLTLSNSEYMEMSEIMRKYNRILPDFEFQYGDPLEHIYLFRNNSEAVTAAYEVKSNGDILLSSYLPYTFGNALKCPLNELWEKGLKDIWRREDFLRITKKINTLEDIRNQIHLPYRNEDTDLFTTEVE